MNKFRECREAAGLAQNYVALMLNVKAPSIVDWEKGRTNPTCDKLVALAKLYNVTVDELLGNDVQRPEFDSKKQKLLKYYDQLNEDGQQQLIDQAQIMSTQTRWTQGRETQAG